jgi:hypothetical protein
MVLPIFGPIYLALDRERSSILDYIAKTAYATKHGQILNDVGRDRLFRAMSDLDAIENAYEQVSNVERLVEGILPEEEKLKRVSPIIEG